MARDVAEFCGCWRSECAAEGICPHYAGTLFDSVNLRFRKMDKKRRYRLTKTNLRQEAFMQRGMTVASTKTFGGNPDAPPCIAADPWFVKPWMVEGTSAAAIAPAIEKGQPSSTNFKKH